MNANRRVFVACVLPGINQSHVSLRASVSDGRCVAAERARDARGHVPARRRAQLDRRMPLGAVDGEMVQLLRVAVGRVREWPTQVRGQLRADVHD